MDYYVKAIMHNILSASQQKFNRLLDFIYHEKPVTLSMVSCSTNFGFSQISFLFFHSNHPILSVIEWRSTNISYVIFSMRRKSFCLAVINRQ